MYKSFELCKTVLLKTTFKLPRSSLFQEEISACAAVHMCYVMDVCDCVWYIIILPCMMGKSFILWELTRLNVSEPKSDHTEQALTSHFWGEKNPIFMWFNLTTSFLTPCGVDYIWKIGNFCLLLKHFMRKLKDFCLIKSVIWREIWNLLCFDG